MKLLRKINKGLVLTAVVLLSLVIYIVAVEVQRGKEKPNIEAACESYIDAINKYAVLPENVQKLYDSEQMPEEEKAKIEEDMEKAISSQMDRLESELKTKMIENDLSIKMQKETVEFYLEEENKPFSSVVTEFNKKISKIKKFVFDEDQVTVTFDSKVEKQVKYLEDTLEENKESTKKADFQVQDETITLKNMDGTWKVVYADLRNIDYSSGFGATTMMVY